MPELRGEELAGFMRGLRPDLPVILCSGCGPASIMLDGAATEMPDKPVDPAHPARRARAALDGRGVVKAGWKAPIFVTHQHISAQNRILRATFAPSPAGSLLLVSQGRRAVDAPPSKPSRAPRLSIESSHLEGAR